VAVALVGPVSGLRHGGRRAAQHTRHTVRAESIGYVVVRPIVSTLI
jgi:hypothetical protein